MDEIQNADDIEEWGNQNVHPLLLKTPTVTATLEVSLEVSSKAKLTLTTGCSLVFTKTN
jgi:hypothetical protein